MPPSTPAAAETDSDGAAPAPAAARPPKAGQLPSGPPRTPWKRIIVAFASVIGLYWVYAIAAVPVIEPTVTHRIDSDTSEADLVAARKAPEKQRKILAHWFKAGDWELVSPKVIESPRGMLLFQDYETLKDGRLRVHPVTMLSIPEGPPSTEEERYHRAVILQAPEGAILQFNSPVDLKQAKVGTLTGGSLVGPITIRSDQREPGPHDDLWIATRDVDLIGDRVISKNKVEFRMGPNAGRGTELEMRLAPATSGKPSPNAPNFGGIHSFELKKDVHLSLQPGQADMFPGLAAGSKLSAAPAQPPTGPKQPKPNDSLPVEIQCDGVFRFDSNPYKATFNDHVDVKRANTSGPYDQLTCKVLVVHFDPVAPPTVAGAKVAPPVEQRKGMPKLEPARIEASGNPVIIRSPSRRVQARGQKLDYNIKQNSGSLTGPGWFKGGVPDGEVTRPLEATWAQVLAFGPDGDTQRLAIEGAAHVEVVGMGQLDAAGIYLYLMEQPDPAPQAAGRKRLVPVRMQATSSNAAQTAAAQQSGKKSLPGVHIKSPQLSGDVYLLQAWFNQPTAEDIAAAVPPTLAQGPTGPLPPRVAAPPSVYGPAPRPAPTGPPAPPVAAAPPTQHFHVEGQLLQLEAMMGTRPQVSKVHIEGGVVLTESRVADPAIRPLIVRGDRLDVIQTTPEQGKVWVTGRPAHVEARELSLNGAEIELDRGENLALVKGQGQMTIAVPTDLSGKALAKPQVLELNWLGSMDFNGTEAIFRDHVVGRLEDQRLSSDKMRAFFDRPILFSQPAPQTQPKISRVLCEGNVFLERRTLSVETGQVATLERMKTESLSVEPITGNLAASGPGWVRSVHVENGHGFALPGAPGAAAGPPPRADGLRPDEPPKEKGLGFLGIHFEGGLTGNQQRQTMNFQDRVRCAYGPVKDWDTVLEPDEPDRLGPSGVALNCDGLQVVQASAMPGRDASFLLDAAGNVRVEGQTYSARSESLTFDQEKDLLILKGNMRTAATLSRQERIGGQESRVMASRIMFWPKTNRTSLDGVQQLNAENPGVGGRR